jgi:phosphotransferase family enzyme
LRSFFPQEVESSDESHASHDQETFILQHNDLSQENIFVNNLGEIKAILDWENTPWLPAWAACDLPALLHGDDWDATLDPEDHEDGKYCEIFRE